MTQKSLHWNGATVGDADALTVVAPDGIGYRLSNIDYESPLVDIGLRMLYNGDENRGPLWGWANELEVTGAGSPIQVDTGGAVVYGMPYVNTAAVNVVVPSPTNDNRNDLIVLRRDWTAQTIRITRIAGIESGGVPALTQSPAPAGTGIYDVPLASLEITPAGVITVTDLREWCQYGTGIRAGGIDTAQLNNNTVGWAERATTTKRLFLPGGDFHALTNTRYWSVAFTDIYIYWLGHTVRIWGSTPIWNGLALTQGWRFTGTTRQGIYATLSMPADWVEGTPVTSNVWWAVNAAGTYTAYYYAYLYRLCSNASPLLIGSVATQYLSGTLILDNVFQTPGAYFDSLTGADATLQYMVEWYNSAGTENIGILGVEIDYTGYI